MSRVERKRNLIGVGVIIVLAIIALGVGALIIQNFQSTEARNVAQSIAQSEEQKKLDVVEEVIDLCDSGQVVKSVAGVDLCDRAATIAKQPVSIAGPEGPIGPAGPRGLPGSDGKDGDAGVTGKTGAKGDTGPAGSDGSDGSNGIAGKDGGTGSSGIAGAQGDPGPMGPPGPAGAAGPVGAKGDTGAAGAAGAAGAPGEPGAQGAAGANPTSFTFTDPAGHAYDCEPDPPGSITYTCTTP